MDRSLARSTAIRSAASGRATSHLTALALLGCVGLATGCSQEDPAPPATELEPYHPLVEGSWWRYAHSDWTERVDLTTASTVDGQPTFTMVDSPNPSDGLRSDSIVASVDGRVVRLEKQEFEVGVGQTEVLTSSVTYGVGFTRFNEDWANQAVGYKETPEYVRVETQPDGGTRAPENRRHTFEIMSLSEEVTTGSGTFDCIVIRRTKDWQAEEEGLDLSDAQTKTFWFARGVGKVQERNEETKNIELLLDYHIPGAGG
jgi:hypothetical protein